MLLKLVPDQTNVPFTKWRFIAAIFSVILVAASIGALATLGLNFGVDFKGGVTIEVSDNEPIDLDTVRNKVQTLGLGDVRVQEIQDFAGGAEGVVVFIEQQAAEEGADEADKAAEQAQQRASEAVQAALQELLGDGYQLRRADVVGPAVSSDLIRAGVTAVVLAIGMMLLYIWFRFEWQFSVGAILALVHDVVITLGMFAVTRLEFSLAIIAAILTIVGYSMNDTVVVYDRVRENLRKYKKKPLADIIDLSINDTLSRTVMTSVTTLLALIALYVIGGEVLRGFTFAMIWGVLIGTYSSVFVAAPALLATGVKRDWSKQPTAEEAVA
ncbi:MAG: protein translocase subunit SecF [Pseudomonadota bacterium]